MGFPKNDGPDSGADVNRFVVFHERPNPSTAYFVDAMLARSGGGSVSYLERGQVPDAALLEGAFVVVVRYLWPGWRKAIETSRRALAGLVYFMDDDLWDTSAWAGLPLRYRWKLWHRACRHRDWMIDRMSALWVSNDFLARKYERAVGVPMAVLPLALPDGPAWPAASTSEEPCFFYHGTASHRAEAEWLAPIVDEVLRRCPEARFEIVASGRTAKEFRKMKRTRVASPMDWGSYLAFCRDRQRAVGLAPVLGNRFNRARSPVKVMDVARAGGVGIYSAGTLFDACVDDGRDGLLLQNDPVLWVDAIAGLLADSGRRETMRQRARDRILKQFGPAR